MMTNRFGQRLKRIRKEVGVSQAYVADHIGVSVQSVSNWECDNTMPDISQIVPLAAILSVSADYLLGVGTDEKADRAELKREADRIFSTCSVNSSENNADILAYELYKEYLNRYPLDYEIQYQCAFAIKDYLQVVKIRKRFDIPVERFEKLWEECNRRLCSVCDNCTLPEVQIGAEECLVDLLLLKSRVEEAESIASRLPDVCGIREKVLGRIARGKGAQAEAYQRAENACQQLIFAYGNALFWRAKALSEIPDAAQETVLGAWEDMEAVSENLIRLYGDKVELTVNGYEKNPYCYRITSFTARSNYLLACGDREGALEYAEKAIVVATEMILWAKQRGADERVMSDILFFARHTPGWCYRWAGEEAGKWMTENRKFQECAAKLDLYS